MNSFDLIVGFLIILVGIKGIVNGFIREICGLVGVVGGVFIASVYATDAGGWISRNIYTFENPSAISLVGFLVLLALVWISSLVVAEILQKAMRISTLSKMNRILGFCFGVLKTFMIFSIIFYAVSNIQVAKSFMQKHTQNSFLYPLLLDSGEAIIKLDAPQEEVQNVGEEIKRQGQQLQENSDLQNLQVTQ